MTQADSVHSTPSTNTSKAHNSLESQITECCLMAELTTRPIVARRGRMLSWRATLAPPPAYSKGFRDLVLAAGKPRAVVQWATRRKSDRCTEGTGSKKRRPDAGAGWESKRVGPDRDCEGVASGPGLRDILFPRTRSAASPMRNRVSSSTL